MSSTGGLLATIIGPATSPGSLLHARHQQKHRSSAQAGSSSSFNPFSHPSSLYSAPASASACSSQLKRRLNLNDSGAEEELVWWDNRVVWSRGAEVHRQWTFNGRYGNGHAEEEDIVTWAGFVWFPPQGRDALADASTTTVGGSSSSVAQVAGQESKNGAGGKAGTFGPFHHSQHATWGGPPIASSSSSLGTGPPKSVRTLLVCLKSKAEVYYPSGEHTTLHLPFPIDTAFPLPKTEGGGVLLQRQLEKREMRRLKGNGRPAVSLLRGMESGMMSVLDEIVDLEDNNEDSLPLPRLYTLANPFEELKAVVEGSILDGQLIGPEEPLGPECRILGLTETPYPFVVVYDNTTREIVFYRRARIPIVTLETSAPTTRARASTMGPQELLAQPITLPQPPSQSQTLPHALASNAQAVPAGPRGPRPSIQRNASTFSTTDRRVSSMAATETMDRTRRGPRVSRGGVVDPQPPTTSTGELQAVLDPPALPNPAPASRITGTGKGKGRARPSILAEDVSADRRQSGSSSFMREDNHHDARPVLFGAADRDIRETTMMMGLDRDDTGSRSEVVLERIWVWKPPAQVNVADLDAAKVFISENLSSEFVHFNIHLSSTLYTFLAEHTTEWTITPFHFVPCSSAVPIIATRSAILDTLILNQGEMQLITSSNRTIPVSLPKTGSEGRDELPKNFASSLSMVLDGDDSMGSKSKSRSTRKVIALSDGVDGRCTIEFDDSDSLKLSMDHRIRDDLVKKCVEAISWVISPDAFFTLKRELLFAFQSRSDSNTDDQQHSRQSHSASAWRTFVGVLMRLLGLHLVADSPISSLVAQGLSSKDPTTRRLAAKLGRLHSPRQSPITTEPQPRRTGELGEKSCAAILLALHLIGQDCRLRYSNATELRQVASLIQDLAVAVGREDWWDYWKRLVPTTPSQLPTSSNLDSSILDTFESPPDIFAYLSRRLITPLKPFPSLQSILPYHTPELGLTRPCATTALVISIYDHLAVSSSTASTPSDPHFRAESLIKRASATVKFMTERGLTEAWYNDLVPGIAMPILEMLRICQVHPQKDWSAAIYDFVGRPDFAAKTRGETIVGRDSSEVLDEEIPTVGAIMASVTEQTSKHIHLVPSLPHVRFGSDRRLAEVERIMQTTRVRTISIQEPKNASDADIAQYHQSVVNTVANRTLAIPIGQGIFEYGTRIAKVTDTFDIPLIELSVKVVPAKQTLQAQIVAENADWPCFHNGVATALSISPECKGIDSSWIVFNRPNTLNPEHGGFLLGLGLNGHLRTLVTYHAFPYMEPRHDFTSVGLLLGLACSFAGSEDLLITKILSLHTHALLPLGSMDLNASAIIQSTSLVGLGLVYAGSKNLRMAEVALAEVGRKDMSGVDGFVDYQESYSFSAAMAFGLIMLGRGGQVTSEVDRRMLAKLTRCIVGSAPSLETSSSSAASYASSTGHGHSASIDTNMTAPGATLALGLMYLKTNRQDIADILEIPSSAFALEHIRPDLLLLRTFVRALIMWDTIAPSLAWIESQLPSFIHHKGHKKTSQMELNVELAYINIVSGACLAIGLKYAGTATEMAHNNLMFFFGVLSKAAAGQSMTYEGKIRRNAARQGLNVVTIALCVVMSGTGELNVLRRLRVSHGQEGAGVTYGTHMAMHMALGILFLGRGHYTLGSSNLAIATMAIAFFPRFLSSPGDNKAYPQAFRHLWALAVEPRCLVARDVQTGETIYLPVKVKLKEAGQIRTQSLISPTLIAPFESILSISVDSPRYWPITYDLADPRDRDALVRTRTIFVKRKAGFLDYNSDPKGNRSIFVKAGSMTGFDLHYDLVSPASPPTISPNEVLQLISTHSGDPHLISMAERFMGDTNFERALRIVLLECVSLDKTYLLSVYLSLLLTPPNPLEAIKSLSFLKLFYSPKIWEGEYTLPQSSRGERQFALIRPNTLSALYRQLTIPNPGEHVREEYLSSGAWQDEEKLAIWLVKNTVPPIRLLQALKEKVQGGRRNDEVIKMRVRDTAVAYAEALAGQYDVRHRSGRGAGGEAGLWKAVSVDEAVRCWTERD